MVFDWNLLIFGCLHTKTEKIRVLKSRDGFYICKLQVAIFNQHVPNIYNCHEKIDICNLMHQVSLKYSSLRLIFNCIGNGTVNVIIENHLFLSVHFWYGLTLTTATEKKKRINSHFLCNNNNFDMNTGHIKNVVISIEEGIKTIYDLLAFVLCFFYFVVSILKVLRDICTGPPQKCS